MSARHSLLANHLAVISTIRSIYKHGPMEKGKYRTRLAWNTICLLKCHDDTTNQTIVQLLSRGPEDSPRQFRATMVGETVEEVEGGGYVKGDFLWVECKGPRYDTPSGWIERLNKAAAKLESAHPDRFVYFVAAIGWKAMLFHWDPNNASERQRIWIKPEEGGDARVFLSAGFAPAGPCRWVDTDTGEVKTGEALELCVDSTEIHPHLNVPDLNIIEAFLEEAKNAELPRKNPEHWF